MSEEKNIEESSKPPAASNKPGLQSAVDSQQSSATNQQVTGNPNPGTISQSQPEPQPQPMEVHKHPHHVTHKKKWGEYFLEFFMIFLAVFLGFMAENWREHATEKRKEKELMKSLVSDLRGDIIRIDNAMKQRTQVHSESDNLINLLTGPNLQDSGAAIYYYARSISRRTLFQANRGSFDQLKAAAGLRLISPAILDSVESYYNAVMSYEVVVNLEYEQQQGFRDLYSSLFDSRIFVSMIHDHGEVFEVKRPPDNTRLTTYDWKQINNFCMKLHLWRRQSNVIYLALSRLKHRAENLISVIQGEYHME